MLIHHKVPFIYPDEHVLSVAARWYGLSGWRMTATISMIKPYGCLITQTKKYVWGDHFTSILHDYYSPEDHHNYIWEHSTLGYEFPFLSESTQAIFLNRSSHTIRPQGADQNRASLEWRWCEDCVREDSEQYGWAYWHTSHQLPLVAHCSKHGSVLRTNNVSDVQSVRLKSQPSPKDANCSDSYKPVSFQIDLEEESRLMHKHGFSFQTEKFQKLIQDVVGLDCEDLRSKHNFHLEKAFNGKVFEWAEAHGLFDSVFKLTSSQKRDSNLPRHLNIYRVACGRVATNSTSAILISKYLNIDLKPLFDT